MFACNTPFSNDPVVVSVGSTKLYLSEIMRQVPEWNSWNDQERLTYLEHWIDEETMYQEAIDLGVDKDTALAEKIRITVRKMVVDNFLQSYADTMIIGDAEKIDYYHAHPEEFVRGRTMISGAMFYFKEWDAGDLFYRMNKKKVFDTVPAPNYLVKKVVTFDSLMVSPDSCMFTDIGSVEVGSMTRMMLCGGALKVALITKRLDSADVLPYDEVVDKVQNQAWLSHRNQVMDRLKKEWKMKRPIFSRSDIFKEKEK